MGGVVVESIQVETMGLYFFFFVVTSYLKHARIQRRHPNIHCFRCFSESVEISAHGVLFPPRRQLHVQRSQSKQDALDCIRGTSR